MRPSALVVSSSKLIYEEKVTPFSILSTQALFGKPEKKISTLKTSGVSRNPKLLG